MESSFDIGFSGYFGEKGIYFQGDIISGNLYFDNPQHTNITGKSHSLASELHVQNRTEQNRTLLITIHHRPHADGVREKGMQYMQSIVIIHE